MPFDAVCERPGERQFEGLAERVNLPVGGGLPGAPEAAMWKTRTLGCSAERRSSRDGVSSVEPSSTKMTS